MFSRDAQAKNPNRRQAFRINQQANLFYRKLADNLTSAPQSGIECLLAGTGFSLSAATALPDSQSRENDTLHVNISTSGIAFTSNEALNVGDYLLVRMLLLAEMTTIVTCCKIVYCKPSNPYEYNRYPYSIGARFVNMTAEDTALLARFVDARKKRQWAFNGLLAALMLTILAMPHQALSFVEGMLHHVVEIVLHLLHLAFEFLEMGLDHLVEHTFHTGVHETQVIVFYIIMAVGLGLLYWLARRLPTVLIGLRNSLLRFGTRKIASSRYYWHEKTPADKLKIAGLTLAVAAGYGYFGL